jgi:hypothetical protein
VTGRGTVARITFRARSAGSTRIGFSRSEALDAGLKPVLPVRAQFLDMTVRARKARKEG